MALQDRAMLVTLKISKWEPRKQDKAAARELERAKGAKEGTARVTKFLLDVEEFKGVEAAASRLRNNVYKRYVVPWLYDGTGALAVTGFMDFMKEYAAAKQEFENEVSKLVPKYADMVRDGRASLGALANGDKYPTVDEFEESFGVRLITMPMPSEGDWRNGLLSKVDPIEADKIRRETEQNLTAATQQAMKRLWGELYESVQRMRDTLASYTGNRDGSFRDTLVSNMADLVERLPKQNLTGDADLDKMAEICRKALTTFDASELRKSKSTRTVVVQIADDILKNMAGKV